ESCVMSRRVLVVQPPDPGLGEPLSEAFRLHAKTLVVEIADATSNLVDRIRDSGCDAVVCWAERAEEMELVVRIRASRPKLPILMVTPNTDETFQAQAIQGGVTTFIPPNRTLPLFVGLIEQAVNLRATAAETKAMAKQGW